MINFVCIKWGDKYSTNYVNNLHNMIKKNYTKPFTFTCYTDNPEGLMNLIKAVVEPNAWGDTATMTYWEGNIVVRATKSIHDQIK